MFHTHQHKNESQKGRGTIPEVPVSELNFSFSRSPGPGGQNVNKVASKVTITWDFWKSPVFNLEQKGAIQRDPFLSNRINNDGLIVLDEHRTRSQDTNKKLVLEKLNELIASALTPRAERKETKVPRHKKQERVEGKRQHSKRKQERSNRYDY